MTNTAEIRRANLAHIKQELASGREYTVRDMAEKTGLSVATCNGILRELSRENVAVYEERQLHDVGRKTCVYHINTAYNSIAYLSCCNDGGGKMSLLIGYLYGGQRIYEEQKGNDFSYEYIAEYLRAVLSEHKGISQVVISLPHTPSGDFAPRLQAELNIPVHAALDMDFWVQNHLHTKGKAVRSVSFLRLHKDCPPVLFNAYEGKIAGRGVSPLQYLPNGSGDRVNVVLSLIAVYSPEEIIFVGDGEEGEKETEALRQACLAKVQGADMPAFRYYPWRERDYFFGMFYFAAETQGVEL
jgi:hypothetical protein